jgi:peptide/nickel transport system permease protein
MWVVATAVFILYFVAPHNVALLLAGRGATEQRIQEVAERLGLNQPILTQYGHYLSRLLHGNLGFSYVNNESVLTIIKQDIPITFSVAIGGVIFWLLIGVGAGILAATRPRSIADRLVTFFALVFYSAPTFVIGEMLLLLFFYRLHLLGFNFFPGGGYEPFTHSVGGWAQHLILPWLTLALIEAATYARLTRASMLDVLGDDYIRTARSKGLSERRVIFRHALRSAATPIVTQTGVDFGALLGGVVVTETIFGLPGLGQQIVQSITRQDLPVIIGIVLLASAFIVAANIIVDALYAVLDPRVRLS